MGAYEFIPNSENCDFSSGDVNIDGVLDILDILVEPYDCGPVRKSKVPGIKCG